MVETAKRVVSRLGLSGFVGFDFVIQQGSGEPYLIEMNLRPTPISHLALDASGDLIGALGGRPRASIEPQVARANGIIAIFPQEFWRDPNSVYLKTAFHDIPTDEPEFVAAYQLPTPMQPGMLRRLLRPQGNALAPIER
jgi:hypothetical protein